MPHTNDGAPVARAAVVILGNDAVLAALPATPVQLAHACLRAGYASVIPASWGDELIASACVEAAAAHPEATTILCACPHVAARLSCGEGELSRFAISLVAPPVAAALYLRALAAPDLVELTYVGDCPAARDPAIDVALSPAEFLSGLAQRGIALEKQPTVYDSVLPPDRRRHFSVPGGAPAAEALRERGGGRARVDIDRGDFAADLAEALLARQRTLVHLAPAVACACAGATAGRGAVKATSALAELEPPRAVHPIVDTSVPIELRIVHASPARAPGKTSGSPAKDSADAPSPPPVSPRRRSPAFGALRLSSSVPVTKSGEGRALPRAYAAKRRTPPGARAIPEPRQEEERSSPPVQTPVPPSTTSEAPEAEQPAPTNGELASRTRGGTPANGTHAAGSAAVPAASDTSSPFAVLRGHVQQLVDAAARRVERHPKGFVARVTRAEGVSYRHRVFVPDAWRRGVPMPVILFLHGAGERGTDNSRQTVVGIGRAIRRHGPGFPALVVLPQAPPDAVWSGAPARVAVQALDAALQEFEGDPDRVYLTGISMGAYGAWQLALQYPDRFAALVPICGGVRPPPGNPALTVRAIPAGTADPAAKVAERLVHVPTWIFHGALDPVIPVEESRALAEAMRAAGAPVRYTEFERVRHNSWDPAYANPELWTWLWAQRRAGSEQSAAGESR